MINAPFYYLLFSGSADRENKRLHTNGPTVKIKTKKITHFNVTCAKNVRRLGKPSLFLAFNCRQQKITV